ncbi:MAG: glutamyl-tRNA reductase [Candidatus Viridilinea halotolerans]|uniref:Glutamyl-tRNA reductase n=1 Tax=Candidatus Viridilinea halotolerans TaxID=2491704 RepID=A0A426TXV5_9CHLR|nr:MAG: glutamyl-tRNA reductase [Candidatus Viridilinea halotolerans]
MKLILAGLDHTTAPVEIREKLAFSSTDLPQALTALTTPQAGRPPLLSEAVILSTCNRVEIYGVAQEALNAQSLVPFLAEFHALEEHQFAHALFFLNDDAVVRHVCATSAGLRSLVLGEAQIQGQVRQAYEVAQASGAVGPVLHRLFQNALTAGKRVRTETALGQGAASVSQAGVELARHRLGELAGRAVLLVGGGEVSELAAQNLLANGADSLMIINRTTSRARELAERYKATAHSFDELAACLARADIVISSTAAPVTIIFREQVAAAMESKVQARSVGESSPPPAMLLIDLAVPRDIASDVGDVPGVHLCTVDDLQEVVRATLGQRSIAAAIAEAIVNEEAAEFLAWCKTQDAVPALTRLREHAEHMRNSELERALRRLRDLSPEQRSVVEGLTRSLVNKLLHTPTCRLRAAAAQGDGQRYAALVADLFNLETL